MFIKYEALGMEEVLETSSRKKLRRHAIENYMEMKTQLLDDSKYDLANTDRKKSNTCHIFRLYQWWEKICVSTVIQFLIQSALFSFSELE